MAAHQMFASRLVELWLYAIHRLSRRGDTPPSVYLAYSISPEVLAIAVQELDARNDEVALQEATPLSCEALALRGISSTNGHYDLASRGFFCFSSGFRHPEPINPRKIRLP
jgi:hypothetical protein